MKKVTLLAKIDESECKTCGICQKICPVKAISEENKKTAINADLCRGCTNCESRCPFHAIDMVIREEPFIAGVDVSAYPREEVDNLCRKAHFNPEQILCYCTGVRAEEVAACILGGATTPEEISTQTGIRTGCTIECLQTVLRMLDAAGIELKPEEGSWRWYGATATAWNLPEEVKEKYSSRGFFFEEDEKLLDKMVNVKQERGTK